ncbi:hypothetical protein C2G38_2194351 [Gigaspora rosea]|uniref:Uncharacterized protein n=1 Tax=Gigaspora rosea TaxID=44941 RepID=A0A397UWR8_9GLOM|nr:hypothetical protein C2G38_2194351 [Gigaspora rosea]
MEVSNKKCKKLSIPWENIVEKYPKITEIEEQSLVKIPISTINKEYIKASITEQEAIRELEKEEETQMGIELVAINEAADHVRQSKKTFCCRLEEWPSLTHAECKSAVADLLNTKNQEADGRMAMDQDSEVVPYWKNFIIDSPIRKFMSQIALAIQDAVWVGLKRFEERSFEKEEGNIDWKET